MVGGTLAQEQHAVTFFSVRPRCKVTLTLSGAVQAQEDSNSIVFDFPLSQLLQQTVCMYRYMDGYIYAKCPSCKLARDVNLPTFPRLWGQQIATRLAEESSPAASNYRAKNTEGESSTFLK